MSEPYPLTDDTTPTPAEVAAAAKRMRAVRRRGGLAGEPRVPLLGAALVAMVVVATVISASAWVAVVGTGIAAAVFVMIAPMLVVDGARRRQAAAAATTSTDDELDALWAMLGGERDDDDRS